MLNHLFATFLICMGVANTTPISNYEQEKPNLVLTTPKKANETTDYTLTTSINAGQTQDQWYRNQIPEENWGQNIYADYYETKYSFSNYNNYISVIGNIYRTMTYKNNDSGTQYLANQNFTDPNTEQYVSPINDIENEIASRIMYVLQLTTYNFNINTELTCKLNTRFSLFYTSLYMQSVKYKRRIYQTTDINFAQYLNRQVAKNQARTIELDIRDINNGFYYQQTEENISLNVQPLITTTINETTNDEIEISLLPNATNYLVISYIPNVKVNEAQAVNEYLSPSIQVNGTNSTPIRPQDNIIITGTNIIPTSVYEVIDIPGLMFEVIGMPFAFVSQAFNLTLFPGTPYQVNIANLFLSIAAIFVFVWLVLLFVKMKG